MKHLFINITKAIILAMTLLFFSCQQQNMEQKVITLKGSLSLSEKSGAVPEILLGKKEDSLFQRSASSCFTEESLANRSSEYIYEITATLLGSDNQPTSTKYTTQVLPDENGEAEYEVFLNEYGTYEIKAFLNTQVSDDETKTFEILSGREILQFTETSEKTQEVHLTMSPVCDSELTGSIALTFYDELEKGKKVNYLKYVFSDDSITDGDLSFPSEQSNKRKEQTLWIPEVPAGDHELKLTFYDSEDNAIYSCTESIMVFSGFYTDHWYGTAPHLCVNSITGEKEFVINEETLSNYVHVNKYESPVILWSSFEYLGATKGFAFFDGYIQEGADITDGDMAQITTIKDFALDAASGKFYVSNGTNIYVYPNYSGAYHGEKIAPACVKTTAADTGASLYKAGKFAVHDGVIWVVLSGNGTNVFAVYRLDTNAGEKEFTKVELRSGDNDYTPSISFKPGYKTCIAADDEQVIVAVMNTDSESYENSEGWTKYTYPSVLWVNQFSIEYDIDNGNSYALQFQSETSEDMNNILGIDSDHKESTSGTLKINDMQITHLGERKYVYMILNSGYQQEDDPYDHAVSHNGALLKFSMYTGGETQLAMQTICGDKAYGWFWEHEECDNCYGSGLQDCLYCNGQGGDTCDFCVTNPGSCSQCNGEGMDEDGNQCSGCGGSGTCPECGGDGIVNECEYCEQGKVPCSQCNGKGEIPLTSACSILHRSSSTSEDVLERARNCFYIPRKFIAIKPDELVIADEGGYRHEDAGEGNENRIWTINLQDESIVTVTNVNAEFYAQQDSDFNDREGND